MSNDFHYTEYRVTRRKPYGPRTLGHINLGARDGHYIVALTEEDAYIRMGQMYPDDNMEFDIQVWRRNVNSKGVMQTSVRLVNDGGYTGG